MPEILACQKCTSNRVLIDGSCFTVPELKCMLNATFRRLGQSVTVDLQKTDNKALLWQELRTLLLDKLDINNDNSWLYKRNQWLALKKECPKLADTIAYLSVRPKFDGGDNGWLNNNDIDRLMMQETQLFAASFYFAGTYWAGHEFLTPKYRTQKPPNQRYLAKRGGNVQSWGIVLNTASQTEGEKHWIALYQESANSPLEYFDPVGNSPDNASLLQNELEWLSRGTSLVYISKRHQHDNILCGAYSCFFLLTRAAKVPLRFFQQYSIRKRVINRFREMMFT